MTKKPRIMARTRSAGSARTKGWWLGTVAGVAVGGALLSIQVGGFVILFLGIALLALFNGGSTHGDIEHASWLASVVVGPVIVASCTGGLAAIIRWPNSAPKWRSVTGAAIASAAMTAALFAGHSDGNWQFMGEPQWWAIYVIGMTGLTALIVFVIGRFRPITREPAATRSRRAL